MDMNNVPHFEYACTHVHFPLISVKKKKVVLASAIEEGNGCLARKVLIRGERAREVLPYIVASIKKVYFPAGEFIGKFLKLQYNP